MAEPRGCGDNGDRGDGGATGGGSEGGVGGGGRWRDRDDVVKVAAILVWCSVGCRQSGEGCGVGGSGVGWRWYEGGEWLEGDDGSGGGRRNLAEK
ncbi:hypothetical protein Tco_1491951 [Tanacetum coccineum]